MLPKELINKILSYLPCIYKGCPIKKIKINNIYFSLCQTHQRDIIDVIEYYCLELQYSYKIYLHPTPQHTMEKIIETLSEIKIFNIEGYCCNGFGLCIMLK